MQTAFTTNSRRTKRNKKNKKKSKIQIKWTFILSHSKILLHLFWLSSFLSLSKFMHHLLWNTILLLRMRSKWYRLLINIYDFFFFFFFRFFRFFFSLVIMLSHWYTHCAIRNKFVFAVQSVRTSNRYNLFKINTAIDGLKEGRKKRFRSKKQVIDS